MIKISGKARVRSKAQVRRIEKRPIFTKTGRRVRPVTWVEAMLYGFTIKLGANSTYDTAGQDYSWIRGNLKPEEKQS